MKERRNAAIRAIRAIPFADPKPALLTHPRGSGGLLDDLYAVGDGHHHAAGNRVITEAVVAALRKRSL